MVGLTASRVTTTPHHGMGGLYGYGTDDGVSIDDVTSTLMDISKKPDQDGRRNDGPGLGTARLFAIAYYALQGLCPFCVVIIVS